MKKRILSFVLAVVMIVGMIPLGTLTAFADVEEDIDLFGWRERFGTYNGYDPESGELVATVSFDESTLTVDYLIENMPEEYRHQSFSTITDATDVWIRYGEGWHLPTAACIDLIEGQLCSIDFGLRLEKTVSSHNWRLERGYTDMSDGQHYDKIRAVCWGCDDPECPYSPFNSELYISLYLDDGKYPVIGPAEMVKEWKKAGLPAPQIHYYSDENCTIDLGTSLPEFYSTFWAGVKVTPPSTEQEPYPEPVMISIEFRHEDVSKKYYYQGYGTQQDPYQISNLYQLIDLAKAVEGASEYDVLGPNDMRGKYFELVNDIGSMDEGMPISIGSQLNPFAGHFDGKGNTVYLDVESEQGYLNHGLFHTLSGKDEYDETEWCPTICNLTVAGTVAGVPGDYAPICSQNYGVIENCTNRVDAQIGICYENRGILRGCVNYGAVGRGGICGENFNLVEECINYGEVTVGFDEINGFAGGICGQNLNLINGCINNGNIIGKSGSFYFGGICGVNEGTIVNCINNGGIIGDKADGGSMFCGGLCGICDSSVANIYNSINRADISASTGFGGICERGNDRSGYAYEMCNCISIGSLDIPDHYALFYGLCEPATNFSIINSYFNGDKVESEELPDRDKALTTGQMKAESNEILDGEGLPQDGKALIDLLNGYIDTNNKSEDGWWYWIKDENGYPIPGKRTYKITVSDTEHGKVTIPSSYMEADTSVPVTVIPEDSYTLKSLKYKIGTGSEIDITSDKSFNMPENAITVIAEFEEIPTHTHTLNKVEAKDATCTEDGISTTYYVCEGEGSCGKYFSDENGENEISAETAQGYTIGKMGHNFTGNYINYEGNKWAKKCSRCDTYETEKALTGAAVPTAKTNLVYNGEPQTGVEEDTGYTLSGNTATDAGTYTAIATLENGYIWEDGTTAPKEIPWEIISEAAWHLAEQYCDSNEGKGYAMGRQGKLISGNVPSEDIGRTIIPLTQKQLEDIGAAVILLGNDGETEIEVTLGCAYTYFYQKDKSGKVTKITAESMNCAAFLIIDNNGNGGTINGYGYYRLYNNTLDNFMFDCLFVKPETK